MEHDIYFDHDEYVVRLGLRGVYFVVRGLDNASRSRELDVWFDQMVQEVFENLRTETVMDSSALRGYRDLHVAAGVSSKKHISSPENLIRTLLRTGTLPRINPIVDLYNAWSIKTLIALGAHDIRYVDKYVSLCRLTGEERFIPLGMTEAKAVKAGEYGYVDAADDILCRMETRQVEKTRVTTDTSSCFFIVQGNPEISRYAIQQCADNVARSLQRFCGAGEPEFIGEI